MYIASVLCCTYLDVVPCDTFLWWRVCDGLLTLLVQGDDALQHADLREKKWGGKGSGSLEGYSR